MKTTLTQSKKWMKLAAAVIAALAWLAPAKANAANPAYLNIDVSVTETLSVAVNGVATSSVTANWNTANPNQLIVGSSATVLNNAGGPETWELSTNANSIDTGSQGNWTLVTTTTSAPGSNAFAVQAVFGSSSTAAGNGTGNGNNGCPLTSSTDWNASFAPPLTSGVVAYSNTKFADSSLTFNGTPNTDGAPNAGDLLNTSARALCWRLEMPSATTITDTQNIQVIVTAANP
jgi:hypothetical protein